MKKQQLFNMLDSVIQARDSDVMEIGDKPITCEDRAKTLSDLLCMVNDDVELKDLSSLFVPGTNDEWTTETFKNYVNGITDDQFAELMIAMESDVRSWLRKNRETYVCNMYAVQQGKRKKATIVFISFLSAVLLAIAGFGACSVAMPDVVWLKPATEIIGVADAFFGVAFFMYEFISDNSASKLVANAESIGAEKPAGTESGAAERPIQRLNIKTGRGVILDNSANGYDEVNAKLGRGTKVRGSLHSAEEMKRFYNAFLKDEINKGAGK